MEGAAFVIVIFDKSNISRILWLSTAIEHWWIKNSSQWGYIYMCDIFYVWYFVHGVWYIWYMFNGGGHDYKTPHSGVLAWGGPQSNRHISPAVYISTLCIYQHFVYFPVIILYNLSHIKDTINSLSQ